MNNTPPGKKKGDKAPPVVARSEKFKTAPTRKLAIELMCMECMGGESSPGVRAHVKGCTSPKCPLYCYRPFK